MNTFQVDWLIRCTSIMSLHAANSRVNYKSAFVVKFRQVTTNNNKCTTNHIRIAGKRQAKKYIRKALSFGVRSGYLIPTDRQGNMLHVCPTLDTQSWNWRQADTESRQRRRIARQGKTRLITLADRKAMRRGILRDKSLRMDNKRMALKKRYRMQAAQSPARNLNMWENNLRKSPGKSLRERSKPKALARKNRLINNFI